MSLSRRLLLLSPLAFLTLFFVALGWRNWHLPTDNDSIFAAVAADYRGLHVRPTDVINQITWRASSPFADGEVTVISRCQTSEPISAALMTQLQQKFPRAHLVNPANAPSSPECSFYFDEIQIVNRFRARCIVSYILNTPQNTSHGENREILILKRSPINFLDSDWHVEPPDVEKSGANLNRY